MHHGGDKTGSHRRDTQAKRHQPDSSPWSRPRVVTHLVFPPFRSQMVSQRAFPPALTRVTLALLLPVATLAQSVTPPAKPAAPPDWGVVARALVKQMQLTKGERVVMVGEAGQADGVVAPLRAAIIAAGATDLGVIAVRGTPPAAWSTDFTRGADGKTAEQLVSYLGWRARWGSCSRARRRPIRHTTRCSASCARPARAACARCTSTGRARTRWPVT